MRVIAALVASLYLPVGTNWFGVQPSGSKLVVTGFAQQGPACTWLTVDPRTLGERGPTKGSCEQPPGRIVPVVVPNPRSFWQTVRLKDGPVLFRYDDASDTKPLWTYGGGSLWVYDVATTKGPLLLRLSAATGRLERTIRMPRIFRPLLAANADGLWLVPATNGGMSGPGAAPVLHVTPAGRVVTIHREGRAALWITAHGHTVWTELIGGTSSLSLWRFDGPTAKATRLAQPRGLIAAGAVYGAGSLWAVTVFDRCAKEGVVRIDPRSGRFTRRATVPALDTCSGVLDPGGMTFFRGSLYFLDMPRLYRVAVSGP